MSDKGTNLEDSSKGVSGGGTGGEETGGDGGGGGSPEGRSNPNVLHLSAGKTLRGMEEVGWS